MGDMLLNLCALYHVTDFFFPASTCFIYLFFWEEKKALVWNESLRLNFIIRMRKIGKKIYYANLN